MSCSICYDDYKGKKVVKVTCQHCPANACRGCQQTYLLQTYEDPHCLTCKRGWSPDFMAANFPLSFRNDALRKHRRKILLEREKTLLPAMQVFVGYRKDMIREEIAIEKMRVTFGNPQITPKKPEDIEANKKTLSYRFLTMRDERNRLRYRLESVNAQISSLKRQLAGTAKTQITVEVPGGDEKLEIERTLKLYEESAELKALRKQRTIIRKRSDELEEPFGILLDEYETQRAELTALTRSFWRNRQLYEGTATDAPAQRREFIMKCADETCRGFLSTNYKCGTCEKWTCTQCLVVIGTDKDAPHTCDANTVETAKTIKSETRPCPKCGTRIFKIDGCDQMWCVMEGCGTAFSWNSGHVVTGTIHNPHYYEWLRRTGGGAPAREVGDIPCGGLPAIYHMVNAIRSTYIPDPVKALILETHRNISELINTRLRDYPARPEALANKDVDVQYLMNNLSEAEWQRQLELSEARFNRKKEIGQILQTLATAGSDMMNHIVNQSALVVPPLYATWVATTATEQLEQLRKFGNDSLKDLAKRDRMAVPQFDAMWRWKAARAIYKPAKVKPVVEAAEPDPQRLHRVISDLEALAGERLALDQELAAV